MRREDVFPSRWIKAADLGRGEIGDTDNVTIREVTWEEIGEERENKAIVTFDETDKALVLNITNWNSIVEITGEEDSDNWVGHRIKLVRVKTSWGAKMVDAVRIEPPDKPKPVARKSPAPAPRSVARKSLPQPVPTQDERRAAADYDPY